MVEYVKLNDDSDDSSKDKKRNNNNFKNSRDDSSKISSIITVKRVVWSIIILIILSILISSCTIAIAPKIAVVPISGEITTSSSISLFSNTASSRMIANQIYTLADDNSIKAIILDINSPGGSPVASDEIAQAILYAKDKKPVYTVFSDLGASGAYWIAVSSDKIYSAPLSIVGSIGVTSATLSFEEFIQEWNITYRQQTAGEFKDIGSPFREQREDEKIMMQNLLDTVHLEFIEHIAQHRNLSVEYVTSLATGEIFLGRRALELELIDEIGYLRDVIADLREEVGNETLVMTYTPSRTSSIISVNIPLGDFFSTNSKPIITLS
ncbi:MAG: signal peptide peptidase SppA [Nanoarchaeota archaeon]|nr:signal peptide peptidase SppA [Nanoarchaeota archaeon]